MHSVTGRSQQGLPVSQQSEDVENGTEADGIQNPSILGLDRIFKGEGFGFRRFAFGGRDRCDIRPEREDCRGYKLQSDGRAYLHDNQKRTREA